MRIPLAKRLLRALARYRDAAENLKKAGDALHGTSRQVFGPREEERALRRALKIRAAPDAAGSAVRRAEFGWKKR